MKGQPSSSLGEETEEMRKWRGMSQDEMDQCWQSLAERMKEEVLDKYKVEDSTKEAYKVRCAPLEWRRERRSKIQNWKVGRWLLGKNLRFVQSTTCSVCKTSRRSQRKEGDETAAKK